MPPMPTFSSSSYTPMRVGIDAACFVAMPTSGSAAVPHGRGFTLHTFPIMQLYLVPSLCAKCGNRILALSPRNRSAHTGGLWIYGVRGLDPALDILDVGVTRLNPKHPKRGRAP